MERPDVFLIQPTLLASEYREKLMGAVVQKPKEPTHRWEPKSPLAINAVPTLDPKPVTIRDFSQVLSTVREGSFKTTLNSIFNAYYGTHKSKSTTHSSTVARRYFMDSPPNKIAELISNPALFHKIVNLFKEAQTDTLYFVTEIVTLAEWTVERSHQRGTEGGVDVTVQDPHTGVTIEAGTALRREDEFGVQGTYENEMIFCMGYHALRLEKSKGCKAAWKRLTGGKAGYVLTPYALTAKALRLDEERETGDGRLGMGNDPIDTPKLSSRVDTMPPEVRDAVATIGFQVHELPDENLSPRPTM